MRIQFENCCADNNLPNFYAFFFGVETMGLSKFASEEVDRKLKDLYIAFIGGSRIIPSGYEDPSRILFDGFKSFLQKKHPDLFDYITDEKMTQWYLL